MTRILGLIGDPVAHSVSPAFQQAALDALRIDARYAAWRTPAAELAARVASLRAPEALGANVTVPYKQAVMALLDEIDPAARRIGAVNTIVNRGGRLFGHNTDVPGIIAALREDGGLDPEGLRAVVLGAGGAARAVVCGLLNAGAAHVLVLNRTAGRAVELVGELAEGRGAAAGMPDTSAEAEPLLRDADLIVNCTTVGMRHGAREHDLPVPADAIPRGAFVMDIVANPLETPLLRAAAASGCRTLGGLAMLVRQGAVSFQLWTARPAPLEAMFAAARRAMEAGG